MATCMMHHINTIDQPPRHHGPGPGRYGEADDGGFLLLLLIIIIIRSPPLICTWAEYFSTCHLIPPHHCTLRTLFISRRQCSKHLPRSEKARHSVIKGDTRHRGHHPPPRPVRHRRRRRPMAVISDTNSSRGVFVVGGDATSITLSLVAIPAIVVFIWQRYQDTQAKHLSVASVSCFAVG